VGTKTQLPGFGSAGFPCDQLRVRANGEVAVACDSHGGLLDASGTRTVYFDNASDPPDVYGRFAALDADGKSFWMGSLAGVLARYDIASGHRVDRWTAGPGLGGIAVYNPPQPASTSPGSNASQTTSGSSTIDPAIGAQTFAMASSAPSLDMPALAVAHGRLLTSGRHAHRRGQRGPRERRMGHARRHAEHEDRTRRQGDARRAAEQERRRAHPQAPCGHHRRSREPPRGQGAGGRQEDERARPAAPLAVT
jgi:hypothetical protein